MTHVISSGDSKDTEKFGELLGRKLKGGEVIELVSDLGGGKTTLTRGIAHGAGSKDVVSSPSFTLSKIYQTPKFAIHHLDFYRLNEAGLMEHELQDVLDEASDVVIVEWGGVIKQILPLKRLTVHIAKKSDESRTLTLTYPEELEYLVE